MMIRILVVLIFAGAIAVSAQAPQTPEAVAKALQARYQGVRDFTADFVQTYRGGVIKTRTTDRGTVAIKKPGKMRWIYTSPERKELWSDGTKTYWYIPEDKQVVVYDVEPADRGSTPALFLSGKGDIVRDFTASFVDGAAPGTLLLKLVPRRPEPEYEHIVLTLDAKTLQIRGIVTLDRQGGESTVTFSNMKENRGLSDNEFVFRVPRGVNVVTDGTR